MTFSRRTIFKHMGLLGLLVFLALPLWAPPGQAAEDQPGTTAYLVAQGTAASTDRPREAVSETAAQPVFESVGELNEKRRNSLAVMDNVFYVFSALLLVGAGLGVALLQGGLVRPVNAPSQTINAVALYAFASIAYLLVGYPLMYGGEFTFFQSGVPPDVAGALASPDWVSLNAARNMLSLQVIIATLATLIVAGAVAERVRFWPLMIFSVLFAGLIYPVQGTWLWGSGWLAANGVSQIAGAPLSFHSAIGWAALAGILVVGARRGKYLPDGRSPYLQRASIPLAAVGIFFLAMGLPSLNDSAAMGLAAPEFMPRAYLFVQNLSFQATGLALATAVVTGAVISQIIYRRINGVALMLAGLGGLVSLNLVVMPHFSYAGLGVAAIGGALVVLSIAVMEMLRLDDPVGVVPVHLVCGVWGSLAAALTTGGVLAQLLGIAAVGAFVFFASLIVWLLLKFTIGLRGSEAEELLGFNQPSPPPTA